MLLTLILMEASMTIAQAAPSLDTRIDEAAKKVEARVIECRRDIHQHPELGNRELRTSKLVADRLRELGIETRTCIAHTGVIGILRGGKPGRVVALRADMDALPVIEQVDLPFKSTVRTTFNGQDVGVMHACGHDAHVAILLGVAEVLAGMREELHGTVKFLFQPAEEGAPEGEEGGAELMVKEGALENPKVDAVFGLHVTSRYEVGQLAYRPEGSGRLVQDQGPWQADAWCVSLAGRRPDRDLVADHPRSADDRKPPARLLPRAVDHHRGGHSRRRAQQHHP
jgi:metal-dependent amidase/aminoacylase/carboxypeptidase family protein